MTSDLQKNIDWSFWIGASIIAGLVMQAFEVLGFGEKAAVVIGIAGAAAIWAYLSHLGFQRGSVLTCAILAAVLCAVLQWLTSKAGLPEPRAENAAHVLAVMVMAVGLARMRPLSSGSENPSEPIFDTGDEIPMRDWQDEIPVADEDPPQEEEPEQKPVSHTPYERALNTLGLPADGDFTLDQLKAQFRDLVSEVHSDRNHGSADEATRAFIQARDIIKQERGWR